MAAKRIRRSKEPAVDTDHPERIKRAIDLAYEDPGLSKAQLMEMLKEVRSDLTVKILHLMGRKRP